MIRVFITDDHGLVRAGLEQLLSGTDDIEVVGTAAGGREAIDKVAAAGPDVVLMDVSMPDLDGIAATRGVLERCPECQVVVLTSFSDRDRIVAALDAGAIGYLLKDAEPDELLRGIRAAARGESPLAPKAARQLIAGRSAPAPQEQLTAREREILALIAAGTPNKVIARTLGIAEKTVKNHISRIFQAIGVTDRTQAALWAQKHFSPEDAGSS
jgi:DNA-binding NarL/FixJ family response regulator